ncbi:5512_t:CDS:1, partial [Dentiscutata erythropus]
EKKKIQDTSNDDKTTLLMKCDNNIQALPERRTLVKKIQDTSNIEKVLHKYQ